MAQTKEKAPAKPAASAAVKAAQELLGAKSSREPAYTLDKGVPRVEVEEGSFVTRGKRVNGNIPSLVLVDGTRRTGMAVAVVAHAIFGGVITDAEVDSLRKLRS